MAYWNVKSPEYVPPSATSPSWVWSIVGWGYNSVSMCNDVIIRLDYVKLDAAGNFVRVNNFRQGWSSGAPNRYIPVFLTLHEGELGSGGGAFVAGYDYWSSQGANAFWKNYIYKFLYGINETATMTIFLPIPSPAP